MPSWTTTAPRGIEHLDWLELVTGFACNCRCLLCSSGVNADTAGLRDEDIAFWLERGRCLGATGVWFGGGEPTLHPGLPQAVERARRLGYRKIRLQTNGLRLAYPAYVERLARAGVTEVALSIKGWDAASHARATRRPDAWELTARAWENLRTTSIRVEADVLLTTPLLPHLADLVDVLAERGTRHLTLWLASLHGLPAEWRHPELAPALGELRASLRQAFSRADALGLPVSSLHTPPCCLAPEDRGHYLHAGRYRLLVVVPGGEAFMAEESPMEGGSFPEDLCGVCLARSDCLGLRAEQLQLHGTCGLEPVA